MERSGAPGIARRARIQARRALQLRPRGEALSRPLPADRAAVAVRGRPYPSGGPSRRLRRRPFRVDAASPYKRATLALKRAVAAVLNALRRVLGSVYQLIFRDQLGNISRQTERLGSASVESVTYLGGEVR